MPTSQTGVTITLVNSFVPSQGNAQEQGNPAGVCILESPLSDSQMQQIAAEVGLSETAFVSRDSRGAFFIRWFTPSTEVPLCGHGTLAAAHVLWSNGVAHDAFPIRFQTTQSGTLQAIANGKCISLDFPALMGEPKETLQAPLENALGVALVDALLAGPEQDATWIAVVAEAKTVREHQPNIPAIAALPAHGIILTAPGDDDYDIVSRYYAPRIGIPEDPVTGSAHCALTPYWANKLGKKRLRAYQASARGGELVLSLLEDQAGWRVTLEGEAITTGEHPIITR